MRGNPAFRNYSDIIGSELVERQAEKEGTERNGLLHLPCAGELQHGHRMRRKLIGDGMFVDASRCLADLDIARGSVGIRHDSILGA